MVGGPGRGPSGRPPVGSYRCGPGAVSQVISQSSVAHAVDAVELVRRRMQSGTHCETAVNHS